MPIPSGYQATATFSRHRKLLPLFFAKFCPSFAPLTDPLRGGGGAKTLEWTVSAQGAFQDAKRLLAVAVPLQHPAPNTELSLATDASDTRIRGVMQQKSGNHWRPLGFFSRKLPDRESRYSTFLAAHTAIKHFRYVCEGRAFQLWTDHKPLVAAISVFQPPFHPDNDAIWHSS